MENPFKFGSIVDGKYFTDRKQEQAFLTQILQSPNHAVLISPRRFGKSSLVSETLKNEKREIIFLNMQAITSPLKMAEDIYRRFFAKHPISKAKYFLSHARIVPTLSINPITGTPEVSLQPNVNSQVVLEDAFTLLEKAGAKKRLIVVLDEFQDILLIEKGMDKILRSIMQEHRNINYILMGSQEDMMKKIFLRKKSPFYHFGTIIHLDRIPADDFERYIEERLPSALRGEGISSQILSFTACHPYYTQQLAFQVWFEFHQGAAKEAVVSTAVEHVVQAHDFDFSRLWESMNKTNRAVLLKLAAGKSSPFENLVLPQSTVFSALKRMVAAGILIKNGKYVYDDPFFKLWVSKLL